MLNKLRYPLVIGVIAFKGILDLSLLLLAMRWTDLFYYMLVLKQWSISHGLKHKTARKKKPRKPKNQKTSPLLLCLKFNFFPSICYGNEKSTNIIPCICIHVRCALFYTLSPNDCYSHENASLISPSIGSIMGREPSCCPWNPVWPVSEEHSRQVRDGCGGDPESLKEDSLAVKPQWSL